MDTKGPLVGGGQRVAPHSCHLSRNSGASADNPVQFIICIYLRLYLFLWLYSYSEYAALENGFRELC